MDISSTKNACLSLPSLSSISLSKVNNLYNHTFFYLFLAVLGLRCCARAFSSCGERGLLFIAVRRLLIVVVASLVVEQEL